MIVGKQKPVEEIIEEVKDYEKILVVGCNECVTVCEAGGKKEVAVLSSALLSLRMQRIHLSSVLLQIIQ